MRNDLIYTYNHNSGTEIVREMTDAEQLQRNKEVDSALAKKEKANEEAELLRQTKINAYKKLGLTDQEIEALLPIPKSDLFISNA